MPHQRAADALPAPAGGDQQRAHDRDTAEPGDRDTAAQGPVRVLPAATVADLEQQTPLVRLGRPAVGGGQRLAGRDVGGGERADH
nr:hypothetical protein [Kineosporia sp. NBRC 101731]